jgi:hypothetical protein
LNLYAYVFNNPINLIDPLGLCAYNEVSGWVHGGLAAIGLIPLLGIVPDLIDAGLYLVEGELLDAGIAGIAAIPIVGYGGRAMQYGSKAVKWGSKYLPDAINLTNKAKKLGKNLYRKILDKLAPKSTDDILVLGRGSPDELQAVANQFGGRVINNADLPKKELFKHIYSEMRKSDQIIQVMDDIPVKQVTGNKTGQWSRAEKIFIDQNPEIFKDKVTRISRSDLK